MPARPLTRAQLRRRTMLATTAASIASGICAADADGELKHDDVAEWAVSIATKILERIDRAIEAAGA
jgi:hypothetical protein